MKKRKVIIVGLLALNLGLLSGCSLDKPFYFDFSRFVLEGEAEVQDVKVTGLNLDNTIIKSYEIEKIQENIKFIFEQLANKDNYYNNYKKEEKYFAGVKHLLSDDYYKTVINGEKRSYIQKSIDNIYFSDNTLYKEANLISVTKNVDNIECLVEVVSVNDDVLFNVETIKLTLDKDYKVVSDEQVLDVQSATNTTKSLDEDSLLQESHKEFSTELTKLINHLKDKELYTEIINNSAENSEFKLESLINNVEIKNKSNDALTQLFMLGKGEFNNYAITSYTIDDIDAMATTTYILSISNKEEIHQFAIKYSRIFNSISQITKK
ncbi:hypothetical protein [Clostridium disporicum]|uniref:hypothetical protein n=1 Tax=Clostridium disporicum TaxID=84024 RepID=UPI0034A22855